jgi:hypothetical protein
MSLALLALVAAAAAATHSSGTHRFHAAAADPAHRSTTATAKPHPTQTPSGTPPLGAVTTTLPATAAVSTAHVTTVTNAAGTTTTTVSTPATGATTTEPSSDKTTQGYLQPPDPSSSVYAFTSNGPMEVSVTWGTNTQLTLVVSCPSFNQSAGGSSAMAVSLPAAEGSCRATVTEPAPETTPVAYSITIG